jgi:hypothetical protein
LRPPDTRFDPGYPPPSNSLNRLRLEAAGLPDSVRGATGYALVSAEAQMKLIQPHAANYAAFYEQAALGSGWAVEAAQTLGSRLGCLLYTLTHNDPQTRAANPDKPAGYWGCWSAVRRVYLGGGMAGGKAGEIVTEQARATLQHLADSTVYAIERAKYPQHLPMLGAARVVAAGSRACVLDFGGSFVKRAIAHYTPDELSRLEIREPLPSDFPASDDDPGAVFERMADMIAQAYGEADAPTIPVSIAVYTDEHGQPQTAQGGVYAQLGQLTPDVPAAFSRAVGERLGRVVDVRLLHDGTSAALFYAPMQNAAVVMLGTALGSGYPVARPELLLRPVSAALRVE